ncbi:extracellular solute-binding protein [Paenibacillus sp. LMG 31459]|jgi:putative aldouronate transport system substrate-binding protein|uniref:Extracellular solute-binding protein n=1 Tax=Paenibacillus phytohabitans TaxID=2654978 RepID=A0ABX1YDF2_9BACL|nr:extracellular solute-binding protein [Paenibacillus phytohabitans]NOU79015.1 extracellular solute-binding protein [Paenibacillus phytohabitans]
MNNLKLKAIASIVLSATLIASLTACSGGKNDDSSSANQKPGNSSGAAVDENPYGYSPAIDLNVGFGYASDFKPAAQETETKNTWMDLYAENGLNIKPMYSVDASQANTKLATAIASGSYPDVFAIKGSELVKYAQTNVIADLTDAYEKYATPELKEYVNTNNGSDLVASQVDGKLYAIPKVGSGYDSAMVMFLRQDWLDNLGLKIPTTMDELVEVARAFTKNDPDQNGKADTYGLALNGKEGFAMMSGLQAFFEGYGAAPGHWNGMFTFIEKDGKVAWGGDFPAEMKKGLAVLQGMYAEGSLAKNFGTMDLTAINKDLGSSTAGIIFAPYWGPMTSIKNAVLNDPKALFTSAPIPDGNGSGSSKAYIPALPETYWVASSKTQNPEALIKLANLSVQKLIYPKDDEEYYKYFGQIEKYSGWKYSLTPTTNPLGNLENYYKKTEALTSGDVSILNIEQKTDYDKIKYYLDAVKDGSHEEKVKAQDPVLLSGLAYYEAQFGLAAVDEVKSSNAINPLAYTYIPTETMTSKYSTLNKMALETIVKIIYGDSVDSYDKFLTSWKALGGDQVTKEAQEWYDKNK